MKWLGAGFPFGTLFVNVTGSFVMGALIALMSLRWTVGDEVRAFLTVGLMGGFTTFSAFSLDFVTLVQRGESTMAAIYVLVSIILAISGIFVGMHVMRALAT